MEALFNYEKSEFISQKCKIPNFEYSQLLNRRNHKKQISNRFPIAIPIYISQFSIFSLNILNLHLIIHNSENFLRLILHFAILTFFFV